MSQGDCLVHRASQDCVPVEPGLGVCHSSGATSWQVHAAMHRGLKGTQRPVRAASVDSAKLDVGMGMPLIGGHRRSGLPHG